MTGVVERCDFYSDEEYEGALQDEVEADREQLAKEEESFTDHLINLGYRRGYAKAIEEFVKRLKVKAEEVMSNPDIQLECKKCTIWKFKEFEEIANELKGVRDEQ